MTIKRLTVAQHERALVWKNKVFAGILEPGDRHWEILCGLMQGGQTSGALVMDAVLAAIALEHGATLYSTDRDFSRFAGLKLVNPLAGAE